MGGVLSHLGVQIAAGFIGHLFSVLQEQAGDEFLVATSAMFRCRLQTHTETATHHDS
jgi:hypothetical protein